MNNKKYLLIILFLIYLLTFLYLIDDVEIEFVGVSRFKYQEFKLNCGSIYDILINRMLAHIRKLFKHFLVILDMLWYCYNVQIRTN